MGAGRLSREEANHDEVLTEHSAPSGASEHDREISGGIHIIGEAKQVKDRRFRQIEAYRGCVDGH